MEKRGQAPLAWNATSYSYNPVYASGALVTGGGRLATETGPLGSTAAIGYTYDQLGRMAGTAINSVNSSMTYDSLGRMTGASNPLGVFTYGYYGTTPRLHTVSNNQNGLNISYSYQSGTGQDFRLTDISNYSSGTTVLSKFDYTYNADGAIATEQQQTDSSTPTIWNYGYDKNDQLLSATRLNTGTNAVLSQYVYGYDPAGNRTSEQIGLGVTQTSVNSLNQITSTGAGGPLQFSGTLSKPSQVTVGGNTATYGNYYSTNFTGLASVTPGTNTVSVVAHDVNGNTATNKYQVVVPPGSSTTPAYDGNGNLTNNGNGQTYTWNARDELLSITYANGASSLFSYDGLGRRVSIVEKNSLGTVTGTKQFVWVGMTLAEERDASNTATKRFFPQGEQISGSNYYYTRDHLGSVREMVDNSGNIQARYDYDPYGRVTKVSGSMDSDFQYAGYYTHLPSSLNLTLFRAYDPNTEKWLSPDPAASNTDLYEYGNNCPIIGKDPLGLTTVWSPDPFKGGQQDGSGNYTMNVQDGHNTTQPLYSISDKDLADAEKDTSNILDSKNVQDALNPFDEAEFDTPFFMGGAGPFYYENDGQVFSNFELNYYGIGMYEAWAGDSEAEAGFSAFTWNLLVYGHLPSVNEYLWLFRGYDAYVRLHENGQCGK